MMYKCIPDGVVVQAKTLSNLERREGVRVSVPVPINVCQMADKCDTVIWHDENGDENEIWPKYSSAS